jgi:drug/metabolite transporter (DMT)-like permease
MDKTKGFFALLFAAIIYTFNDVCIRILGSSMSGYQQVTLRSLIGLIFVCSIIFFQRKNIHLLKTPKRILLLYTICFPIVFLFFNLSILITKIANTVFSFTIGSLLFSLFLEKFIYKEKTTKTKVISTIFAIVGLCFFTFPLSRINLGFILGIGSGVIYTFINILVRHAHHKTNAQVLVAFQLLGGSLIGGLATLFVGQTLFPVISFLNLFILIFTGITIALVTYLVIVGFKNFDLNLGTIIVSSELFLAPLFAFFLFKESLTILELIGGLCIAIAIIFPHASFEKKSK